MKKPIKEHVFVIRFDELPSDDFAKIKNRLSSYLSGLCSGKDYSFDCKIASIPRVQLPEPTFDGSDPNWASLKIRVQRVFRYVCKEMHIAVQLSNGFMTMNALHGEGVEFADSFGTWLSNCEKIVGFLGDCDLPQISFSDSRYECVYEFSEEHLLPFLQHRDRTDYYDYLELREFMHNPCQDPQLKDVSFYPPFYQRARYDVHQNGKDHHLRIEINVPKQRQENNKTSSWHVRVDMTCFDEIQPSHKNLWGVHSLRVLYGATKFGLSKLLSVKAKEYLKEVLNEDSHV